MAQPLDVMLEIEPNDIRQHPGLFMAKCRWQERCRRKMTGVGQKYWRRLHRREVVGEMPRDEGRRLPDPLSGSRLLSGRFLECEVTGR
jgi:hypothetical protein